jgi:hypothetical protein
MAHLGLTGIRLQRYNALPAHLLQQPADLRFQTLLLQRQQRASEKSVAQRNEQRIAREELEKIYLREAKKEKAQREKEETRQRLEREQAQRMAKERARKDKINARLREKRAEANKLNKMNRDGVAFDINIPDYTQTGRDGNINQDTDQINAIFIQGCTKLVGKTHAYLQFTPRIPGIVATPIGEIITITGGDAEAIYWNSIRNKTMAYNVSDGWVKIGRFVCLITDKIPSKRIKQMYRDGVTHCVIEPLVNLWQSMADRSESDASRKRCGQIANKIRSLEVVYGLGVPEERMEEVAKIAQRCIILHDIIGNETTRYNAKSNKFFHFTNTRANHLDTGYVCIDKQYVSVSQSELNDIIVDHDEKNEFFLFCGDLTNNCRSIRSARGAWAVFNPDHELFKEFSTNHNIQNYGVNAVKYPLVNAFIREARIINSAPTPLCDEPNDLTDATHIDVEKAYTQHNHAPFYKGFLGHVQQWRRFDAMRSDFIVDHLGIYQFRVVENPNQLLKKLGVIAGQCYTLQSPEIEYFMSLGVVIELIAGCWGSSFDIKYTDEMLANRHYCTWAGKLGMDSSDNTYTFQGNATWASHLKAELGDDRVLYFKEKGIIVIRNPKKSYYTTHHILGGITSYTRMNMLELMREVKGELIKVILDGIYFRGELPNVELPCGKKEVKQHLGFRSAWYYPSEIDCSEWPVYESRFDGNVVLAGAGGTGKSHSVFNDKGIINPLYVVPSHVLGRASKEKYGCNYTTIHKLIGIDCRSFKETHYEPGVIFLDELTMIDAPWVDKMISMYPRSLLLLAGDIDGNQWYQCRNGKPGAFSTIWNNSTWRYETYTQDWRSKDEELRTFKQDVRSEMKRIFTNGGDIDSRRMNHFVSNRAIGFFDAVSEFRTGDVWIAGTHSTNEKLLAMGVVSGYIDANKEIVYSGEGEKRGSFTTHSFQGLTIPTKRVFISLDFFEYAMLYTSISRVCTMGQLIFVQG